MKKIIFNVPQGKDIDSSFTFLFSLLKRYENSSLGEATLAYNADELLLIHQHTNNAVDILLQGLQDIGQLIGKCKNNLEKKNQIGFLISAISNLTAALNDLRSDTDYVLKQRGIVNY